MSKDVLFHLNICEFKKDEIATVGDPAIPNLTDEYASKLVKAGWASWFEVDIETVEPVTDTVPEPVVEVAETEPEETNSEDEADEQSKQPRRRRQVEQKQDEE